MSSVSPGFGAGEGPELFSDGPRGRAALQGLAGCLMCPPASCLIRTHTPPHTPWSEIAQPGGPGSGFPSPAPSGVRTGELLLPEPGSRGRASCEREIGVPRSRHPGSWGLLGDWRTEDGRELREGASSCPPPSPTVPHGPPADLTPAPAGATALDPHAAGAAKPSPWRRGAGGPARVVTVRPTSCCHPTTRRAEGPPGFLQDCPSPSSLPPTSRPGTTAPAHGKPSLRQSPA